MIRSELIRTCLCFSLLTGLSIYLICLFGYCSLVNFTLTIRVVTYDRTLYTDTAV